jgi:hypothetical protein
MSLKAFNVHAGSNRYVFTQSPRYDFELEWFHQVANKDSVTVHTQDCM